MHVSAASLHVFLSKLSLIHPAEQKVARSCNLLLPQPNHDPSPRAHWPGSYVHLEQPFPDSIKEAAELRETEGKNGGAESLTTSTMTTTVSESSPAFWRGHPLKIWESHSQQHTEHSQLREGGALTGPRAEAKNVYKQLAVLTNNKERNCPEHSLVSNKSKKLSQIGQGTAVRHVWSLLCIRCPNLDKYGNMLDAYQGLDPKLPIDRMLSYPLPSAHYSESFQQPEYSLRGY